jgi:mRNA interferase HigB
VRIISKAAITEFTKTHKDAVESLLHWYGVTKRAAWRHLVDVRADFPHADAVDIFTVFNISGNTLRYSMNVNIGSFSRELCPSPFARRRSTIVCSMPPPTLWKNRKTRFPRRRAGS